MADGTTKSDEFEAAFAQFTTPGEKPEANADPAPEDNADPAPEDNGDPAPEDNGDPAPEDNGDPEPEDNGDPAPEGDADPAPDTAAQLVEQLKKLIPDQQRAEPEPEPETQETQEQPAANSIYNDEEREFLANYEKEWPEVHRAEMLRRKAEYHDLLQYVFTEIAQKFNPIAQTVETLAVRAQLGDIKSRADDYEEIRDDVVAWVDTQPEYLQAAYKQVMKQGTADEVIDLIDRFRKETGRVQTPPAPEKKAEPSDEAKQAARSMAPVSSKRSAVPQGDDPNDFEGAFKRFAGQSRA